MPWYCSPRSRLTASGKRFASGASMTTVWKNDIGGWRGLDCALALIRRPSRRGGRGWRRDRAEYFLIVAEFLDIGGTEPQAFGRGASVAGDAVIEAVAGEFRPEGRVDEQLWLRV